MRNLAIGRRDPITLSKREFESWFRAKAVKTCQDKLLFSRSLESSAIPPIDSSVELSQLNCNFFAVKERSGSASRSIGLNLVAKEAIEHAKGLDRPIFQPMIEGKEFSAETWINASGKCHGMLLRWRTKIIDGEAHQTETFENREWQKLLKSSFEAIQVCPVMPWLK